MKFLTALGLCLALLIMAPLQNSRVVLRSATAGLGESNLRNIYVKAVDIGGSLAEWYDLTD